MSELLYTVREVFSDEGYLREFDKTHFNIPLYQRGYKWEAKQINKLLDDIDRYEPQDKKFYCLQNITIVPVDNYFNVVDGQQRLTTLVILLSFLNEKEMVNNKVRFPQNSIRKETDRFINDKITKDNAILSDNNWLKFITLYKDFDHQDIFYIFSAHFTIKQWLEGKSKKVGFTVENFIDKLLDHVKIIVNRIDNSQEEEKIFGNLNSKRVPLDGADLIRAILITRVANEEGKREGDIKNIVRVNERRIKIGWELDQINNWWSRQDVQNYFKKFIVAKSEEIGVGNKLFNEEKYPVNLLYLLFAEKRQKQGTPELTLALIEENNNNALGLYKDIIKLHTTLQDWYQDREMYHFLGFLFFNATKTEINFSKIWKQWVDPSSSRESFKRYLKTEIKKLIFPESDNLNFIGTDKNWYSNDQKKLVRLLLLMDIIISIKTSQAFLPYSAFTKSDNDIEHIFPQNPEEVKEKKEYIEFLNANVVDKKEQFDLKNFDANVANEKYLKDVDAFIQKNISNIKINSIGNLVLLYYSLNRSLGRISYSRKRSRIVAFFNEGNFIQPHTFRVFVRYFNDKNEKNKELEHWTNKDIEANEEAISITIKNFFENI